MTNARAVNCLDLDFCLGICIKEYASKVNNSPNGAGAIMNQMKENIS
jgi:hypothetical protein